MPYGFADKVNDLQRIFREKRRKPYDRAFYKVKEILDYGRRTCSDIGSGIGRYRENFRPEKDKDYPRGYLCDAGLCGAEEDFWDRMNDADPMTMEDCLDPCSPYHQGISMMERLISRNLKTGRRKVYACTYV